GPVKGVKHDVRLETGAELAGRDASTDDLPGDLAPGGQPMLGEGLAQALVDLGAPDQRPEDLSVLTAERACNEAHGRPKTLAGGCALLDRRDPCDISEHGVGDDGPRIGPAAIDRRLADTSPRGDALHSQAIES